MTLSRTLTLAAIFAIGTSVGGYAQETAGDGDTVEAPLDDLSLGEAADAPTNSNQPYVKETIGDWDLRCLATPDGGERCQMYQLLSDDQGSPVVEFSLFRLPSGGRADAGATVVVPLETALQQQLTLQVDSSPARRYPFAFCNQVGCYARIGLTAQDIAAYRAGNAARLTIAPFVAQDQEVNVTLSLTGFTAAYEKASIAAQ